ncbi:hypothetical protein N9H93_00600 [Rhizobiaceae bacterium]|nr:hypothetical protein [Rhizobiaceae bacterium]
MQIRQTRVRLLGASTLCAMMLSVPATALAQGNGCAPVAATAVATALASDLGRVKAEDLSDLIEQSDDTVQMCETQALIAMTTGADVPPELMATLTGREPELDRMTTQCLGGMKRGALAKALLALGLLRKPWGADDEGEGARSRFEASMACLDRSLPLLTEHRDLREVRGALEQALANAAGGYGTLLSMPEGSCEQRLSKAKEARAIRERNPASEISVKTIIVEAVALMGAAQLGSADEAGRECLTHEAAMRTMIATVDDARASGLMAKSLEGWRWANDLAAMRSSYLATLGDFEAALADAELLTKADLDPPSDLYANAINPAAVELLNRLNKERENMSREPYEDQVFVSRTPPGYGTARPQRRYVANADFARALKTTIAALKANPPEGFPCRNSCKPTLDRISSEMSTAMIRTDLVVVVGSFQDDGNAERGLQDACGVLRQVERNGLSAPLQVSDVQPCPFGKDRVGSYHRVSSGALEEAKAEAIRDLFQARKLPVFLSRQRIADPL